MRLEMKKTLALAEDHRSYFRALATIEEEWLRSLDHYEEERLIAQTILNS